MQNIQDEISSTTATGLFGEKFSQSQIYEFDMFSEYDKKRISEIIENFNERSKELIDKALEDSIASGQDAESTVKKIKSIVESRRKSFEDYKVIETKNLLLYQKLDSY